MFRTLLFGGAFLFFVIQTYINEASAQASNPSTTRNAVAHIQPQNNSGVQGTVSFQQVDNDDDIRIVAEIRGLTPNSHHGFHIHAFGDISGGCQAAGPHYNPSNVTHGGPTDGVRHVGDLGNIRTDEHGVGRLSIRDPLTKLFGDTSVLGRAVVVHQDRDDHGRGTFPDSNTTGHAGARLACGSIVLSQNLTQV